MEEENLSQLEEVGVVKENGAHLNCVPSDDLQPCCRETIEAHALYNPMILCQTCKRLIKCFKDSSEYRNYTKFCNSRGRSFETAKYDMYDVVLFNNYEPFR